MPKPSAPDPAAPRDVVRPEVSSTLPVTVREEHRGRRLLVIVGSRASTHPLPQSGSLTLGRGSDADVRIDDPSVSRRHARIELSGVGSITVRDTGSSNGTRVRGQRLSPDEGVTVAPDETFEVGNAMLMVQQSFRAPSVSGSGSGSPGAAVAPEPRVVVGEGGPMAGLYQLAQRVAGSTINVLLLGETGVGKDVMARRIHGLSPRAERPFLPLNCGSLSEQLLESELFGHEKGAFTGAVERKRGLLEAADGGTVFLDEVGELPMSVQVKLLRVLEERQVRRVGGLRATAFDIRFIAATNRDLDQAIAQGEFRSDLYYRLNGISLVIPPLRQRVVEIEGLATQFVTEAAQRAGYPQPIAIRPEALAWLRSHPWPGNIRELHNCIERAVLLCNGAPIGLAHLPAAPPVTPAATSAPIDARDEGPPEHPERRRILDALEQCAGNQTRAAKLLGISRNTLLSRLDQYDIPRPRKR